MMWEEALTARLAGDEILSLVVRGVHWKRAPQALARPFIVLTLVSDARPRTMEDFSPTRPSVVQIDLYDDRLATNAAALRERIVTVISAGGSFGGFGFEPARITALESSGEDVPGGTFVHRERIDAIFWHD